MHVVYVVRTGQILAALVCLICLLGQTEICSSMDYVKFEREVQMATKHGSNGTCEVALTKYLDFAVYQPFRGVDLSDWRRENETLAEFVKRTQGNSTIYGNGHKGRHRRQANATEEKAVEPKKSKYLTSCVTAGWGDIMADQLFPSGSLRAVLTCFVLLLLILLFQVGYTYVLDQEYTKFGAIVLSCVHVLLILISAVSLFVFRSRWYKTWELGLVETPVYPSEWLFLEATTWLLGLVFFIEIFLKHFLNGQFVYSTLIKSMPRLETVHIISAPDDALRSSYELVPQ